MNKNVLTSGKMGVRDRTLLKIARLVERRPKTIILVNLLLAGVCVLYTLGNLEFQTGRNELVSQDLQYNRNFKKFRREFGDYDGLIVVARGENTDRLEQFMDALGAKLKADPAHFRDVFFKIDTGYFRDKFLLFLNEKEIKELFDKLRGNRDMIAGLNEEPGLANFFRQVNFKISRAMAGHLVSGLLSAGEEDEKSEPVDLSLMNNILEQMKDRLAGKDVYKSPWTGFLHGIESSLGDNGYLSSKNGDLFLMTVNPMEDVKSFSSARTAVKLLRRCIAERKKDFPGIQAGVTGSAALESDETIASQNDTVRASIVALIGVALVFVLTFRGIMKPLLALISLIVSLCWTLGWTTLFIGHLNVISVVFITILIGLGIDFGIHLLMRYEEERKGKNNSVEKCLEMAIRCTGQGILVGALTTALAFYTMAFADFRGIVELGLIAGSGVLLSLVAMLVLLPAMLLVLERNYPSFALVKAWPRPDVTLHWHLLKRLFQLPRLVLLAGLVWMLYSLYCLGSLKFDYNLLRLQNEATESVRYEREIINHANRSTWYGAITADSLEQARKWKRELEALPTVGKVESVISVYPDDQVRRIQWIRKERGSLEDLPPVEENTEDPLSLKRLKKTLGKISFKLQKGDKAWDPGNRPEPDSLDRARALLKALRDRLETMGEEARFPLERYQERLFADYRDKFGILNRSMDPSRVTLRALPKSIKDRFVGKTGKFLLQIYPSENIWDRAPLDRFIHDLRKIDPEVTGLAVQAGESARLMKEGYFEGGLYALIAIVLITYLSFNKLRNTLLAMFPLFVGFGWLIGFMHTYGLRFNLANLIILPLIIGIGVDNGIHVVARYLEQDIEDPVSIIFTSTGKGIMLCSLTTMIGFGSLMVADHYGIFSIGLLLTLGVGSCLIASTTILPLVFRYLEKGSLAG